MTGILIRQPPVDGGCTHDPFVHFQGPSEPQPPGCFDRRISQEWFRKMVPWPIAHSPDERLLAWLEDSGIRHEWHAVPQVAEEGAPPRKFEGVFYMIRFFNKTDATAYRLIFE